MSIRRRKAIDGFWVMAVIVGAMVGGLARPIVVHCFWWSVADPSQDAVRFGIFVSVGLGLLIGGLPGMIAGIATDDRILQVVWPALASVMAAVVSIGTAYGTFCCLCVATADAGASVGSHTPAASSGAWTAYVICMGIAGAAPVLIGGVAATVARRHYTAAGVKYPP
jgi:hypothetical protein